MITLRDYQLEAVDRLRFSFQTKHNAPCLALPTGGGKTIIFAYITHNAVEKGQRVLILAHRRELIRQAVLKVQALGLNPGVIAPGYTYKPLSKVQVASVQTLVRRTKINWQPTLIVIDEAHHATATTYRNILSRYPDAKVLGVTATPCRSDGAGLADIFDDLVVGPSVQELIDGGYLSPFRAFAPPQVFKREDISLQAGDFNKKELDNVFAKPKITGDAVKHYKTICAGAPAIVFCVSVRHAEETAKGFREAGFKFYAIDGKTDPVVREKLITQLGTGEIDGLTSCDIISEGTDIPIVTAAILLRPTMSKGLYLQQVGRVLRPGEGKTAIILDHVGNIRSHGLPSDDQAWELHASKPKRKKKGDDEKVTAAIKVCLECFAINKRVAVMCEKCQAPFPDNGRQIESADGELLEVDIQREKKKKKQEVRKARTLAELIEIGKSRGYKPGWAQHVYRSRKKYYEKKGNGNNDI